eukprot:jgi/Bigna1/143713/aug1.80_g18421
MVRVKVIKVYPVIVYEKLSDGKRYRRNQRAECKAYARYQKRCQEKIQEFIAEKQKGDQRNGQQLQSSVQAFVQGEESLRRKTSCYFTVLLEEVEPKYQGCTCILTVWLKGADMRDSFTPGAQLELYGCTARFIGKRGLELSTGRHFFLREIGKGVQPCNTVCSSISELHRFPNGKEFDIIADDEKCFFTRPPHAGQQLFIANLTFLDFDHNFKVFNATTSVESEFSSKLPQHSHSSRNIWDFLQWFARTDSGKSNIQSKMSRGLQMLRGECHARRKSPISSLPNAVVAEGIFAMEKFKLETHLMFNRRKIETQLKPKMNVNGVLARAKFKLILYLDSCTHLWPLQFSASTFRRLLTSLDTKKLKECIDSLIFTGKIGQNSSTMRCQRRCVLERFELDPKILSLADILMFMACSSIILTKEQEKIIETHLTHGKSAQNMNEILKVNPRFFIFSRDEWENLSNVLRETLSSTYIRIKCRVQNSGSNFWHPVETELVSSEQRSAELLQELLAVDRFRRKDDGFGNRDDELV